jgi:hypothetical protein
MKVQTLYSSGDAVSVIFTLGSCCGVISLIWLILNYRRDAQRRLRVVSTRGAAGGVDVLVQYRPARTRVGLKAVITLIEPATGDLVGGDRQERADRYGVYAAKMTDESVRGRSIEVALKNLQPDPPGQFAGLFSASDAGARLRIEIWAAGPTKLESREVSVRAMNI